MGTYMMLAIVSINIFDMISTWFTTLLFVGGFVRQHEINVQILLINIC